MTRPRCFRRLPAIAVLLTGLVHGAAICAAPVTGITARPESGINVRLDAPFKPFPSIGFMPLRATVENRTDRERTWAIASEHASALSGNSQRYETTLAVPAQSERVFELTIPLAAAPGENVGYSRLSVTLTGYGIEDSAAYESSAAPSGALQTSYLICGQALANAWWSPLQKRLGSGSRPFHAAIVEAQALPSDWRAYSGAAGIFLAPEEWRSMLPEQRMAALDWTRAGGSLHFCASSGEIAAAGMPPSGRTGLGNVAFLEVEKMSSAELERFINGLPAPPLLRAAAGENFSEWPLASQLSRFTRAPGLMLGFLILFAIVVGPINFLFFARPDARHRLLWTTPAISIVASLGMAGYIVLKDGVGGEGIRNAAIYVSADNHRRVTCQEQIARTGLLTDSRFSLDPVTVMLPIPFSESRRSPVASLMRNRRYVLAGDKYSGDWFQSRSLQAHLIVRIDQSRERIDLQRDTDGSITAISSLGNEIDELFVFDSEGNRWFRAGPLPPGDRRRLDPSTESDFRKWLARSTSGFGPPLKAAVPGHSGSYFYASSKARPPIDSLQGVRWKNAQTLLHGETSFLRSQ